MRRFWRWLAPGERPSHVIAAALLLCAIAFAGMLAYNAADAARMILVGGHP